MRLALCLVLLLGSLNVMAQDKKGQDAQRRLQQANQKLAGEKAALERDKAQLTREKADLAKERDELKEGAGRLKGAAARQARDAKQLREEGDKLKEALAAAAQREEALKGELARTAASLQAAQRNGEQLGKRLGNQGETSKHWQAKAESCEGKNVQLLELNGELLERYRVQALAGAEPFTGITRARLENLVEEYRDRLVGARFKAGEDLKEKSK